MNNMWQYNPLDHNGLMGYIVFGFMQVHNFFFISIGIFLKLYY